MQTRATFGQNDSGFHLSLAAEDANKNIVSDIASVPAWSNDSPNLGTLTVGPDGMSATFTKAGPAGTGNVSVAAVNTAGGQISGSWQYTIPGGISTDLLVGSQNF